MKYFIIAGEQSGDLHGSNLIRGIRKSDPEAVIACWGGDLMKEAGAELLSHYKRMAFMGYINILLNIRTVLSNMSMCKKQLKEFSPDVVILIDYPGFNLRIAEFAKEEGIKVFYYISPKLWAWKEYRVESIRKYVDRMFIIFPFEVDFYRKHNIEVEYHGNPLVDEIERKREIFSNREELKKTLGLDDRPVIAMLAGSRKLEINYILPEMVKAVKNFSDYQFVLACVESIPEKKYREIIGEAPIRTFVDKTYELLWVADAALVKSGTSTLESALIGIPQVVCYKADTISFEIVRRLVKIKFISLVNLIMEREVVRELIQYNLKEENIVRELRLILPGGVGREKMLMEYKALRAKLGPAGASTRIASEMVSLLKQTN